MFMVACTGPPATASCEPRQVRKEAAAVMDSCAGMWWVRAAFISSGKYKQWVKGLSDS